MAALAPVAVGAPAAEAPGSSAGSLAGASVTHASPACGAALAALHAEEARLAGAPADDAERRTRVARLEPWRAAATRACLGREAGPLAVPAPAQRTLVAPTPVPSAADFLSLLPRRALPPGANTPKPRAPLSAPTPPISVGACDVTGCWASDGSRLQRAGPNLVGPRGFCSAAGAQLVCP